MKEVIITKYDITGVNNPFLKITGIYNDKLNFELLADNQKIEFNLEKNKENNTFVLTSVAKGYKNIILNDKNNNQTILKIKNSKYKRLLKKVKGIILDLFTDVIYEVNDFIGIQHITINGIKNPLLKIEGTINKKNYEFYLLKNNGEKIKINPTIKGNDFIIEQKINSKDKKMALLSKIENKEYYVAKIKNKKIKRIKRKIKTILHNLFTDVIYEVNDFIGIQNITINGIKNPLLKIKGTINKKNYEFYLLKNNGEKIKLNLKIKSKDFIIEQKINSKDKKLLLIATLDGKDYNIAKIKNKLSKRIINKLKSILFSSFYKININNNIEFASISLEGIIHPVLTITGKKENLNQKIIFESNNKKLNYSSKASANKEEFYHYVELSNQNKKVYIYLDNELILIVYNKIFFRILNKITSILKRIIMKIYHIIYVFYRGVRAAWKQYHFLVPPRLWKKYWIEFIHKMKSQENKLFYNPDDIKEYNKWLKEFETKEKEKIEFKYKPLISILVPVYNINKSYLSDCIDSILKQSYENFEICLVDDASTKKETIETLKQYEKKDSRIKVKYRNKNGHISRATNDALEMAKGEFIGLVDNDDLLSENALYEVVKILNENKKLDFIYSDEDKLNKEGERCYPHFKPDFSPDTLLSLNYICHFTVIRKKLVEEVGGFELGLEGAQDHDLFLKVTEKTKNIYHIPKILYHWRMIEGSTASNLDNKSYANDKGKIAIENALKRRKILGYVEKDDVSTYYRVNYEFKKQPKISIIIPTRDYADILKKCLESIYEKTTYEDFEIIIANNGSIEKNTFDLFNKYKNIHKNFNVVDINTEFNYSYINNFAIKKSKGEYIVLLNNDTEIITPNWLETMVGYASQKHVGAVGVKLLYPDKTIQHAGVILGLGGVASHAYIGASRKDIGMYGRLRVPYDYAAVTAACLMVSRKKFDEVGGLEEDLKVAYNDVDFNIKLLEKGYYNVFLPQVELFHHESKSRGFDTTTEKYKRFLKESNYMYKKWNNIIEHDKMYNVNFSKKGWFMLDRK